MSFFVAGAKKRQRLMLAANRVGKTEGVGLFEVVCHATGWYPDWWIGKRFDKPVRIWIAGDSGHTVKEILQVKLLGRLEDPGHELIPGECIHKIVRKSGVPDAVDTIYVKHSKGGINGKQSEGYSTITFKSYEQGVDAFMGTEIDVILLDEEPPLSIYTECLVRTMTNGGIILCTFTPLNGVSDTVLFFLPGGKLEEKVDDPVKFVVMATWDDVPHLTEEAKQELWNSIPPFQRDARSKGIPQLGAGAIFPINEDDIIVDDFSIPDSWPRAFGLDVGWNRTAAIWGARNPDTGEIFLYSEHYRGQAEPVVHGEAIKARGKWIPGVIDPASRGRSQIDGRKLIEEYREQDIDLTEARNVRESGLLTVWQMLSTGKLKLFKSLSNTRAEYRLYRRDETGKVVKENDHLMDAMRYLVMSGFERMKLKPKVKKKKRVVASSYSSNTHRWMGY